MLGYKRSPEQRTLFGWRASDSDGFTYRYGKYRGGYKKKPRHTKANRKHVRHDKRAVKQAELNFEKRISEISYGDK